MDNSEKKDQPVDDVDLSDRNSDGEGSMELSSSVLETAGSSNPSMARRLSEIFMENGDGDLLLRSSDRGDGVLQWVRALDLQVMGACRADERLKPLLKLNVSTGVAEDRLWAHLSQHFEPSEIGMLARCLCIPLVSVRVGKINKQGALLSPTSIRGNLCLTLLPTSDLRISFNGDDCTVERLLTLSKEDKCTAQIKDISADKSGRSFLLQTAETVVSYFWCSEKSKLLGDELLRKIKDLLVRRPSLAELTGISEPRLSCFATHLRAYLAGSIVTGVQVGGILSASSSDVSNDTSEFQFPLSSFNCQKNSRPQQLSSQGSKSNPIYQGGLSPRSNSFKEGLTKSLCSIRSNARGKLRRRGDSYVSCVDGLAPAFTKSVTVTVTAPASSGCFEKEKLHETKETCPFPALKFLDIFGKSPEIPPLCPDMQVPSSGPSDFTPHYCWCPPVASTLQYTLGNAQFPLSFAESETLPPLASLLSATRPSGLLTTPKQSLNLAEIPPLDFPHLLSDPLARIQTSQQIPAFTPMICDPIVHVPVIDICSSGPGYLVSAGPALSTTIPSLNANLVDPLLPNAVSVVEKGARETLRMLINSSSQPNPQLLEVFPSVLSGSNDKHSILVAGSRGLYTGVQDVDIITDRRPTMGFVFLSDDSIDGSVIRKGHAIDDDLINWKGKSSDSGASGFDEEMD